MDSKKIIEKVSGKKVDDNKKAEEIIKKYKDEKKKLANRLASLSSSSILDGDYIGSLETIYEGMKVSTPKKKRVTFKKVPEQKETYGKEEYDRKSVPLADFSQANIKSIKESLNKIFKKRPVVKKK